MIGDIWYRYEDKTYAAPLDEFDKPIGSPRLEVLLRSYQVMKHTTHGVWLSESGITFWRFVLHNARKRFACPTIEEAKTSFIARKTKQARIYRARAQRAEEALAIINNLKGPFDEEYGSRSNLGAVRTAGEQACNEPCLQSAGSHA